MTLPESEPLLPAAAVRKLTDAAQTLFTTLYKLEQEHEAATKRRLTAILASLDLYGLEPNHEDYVPGERS